MTAEPINLKVEKSIENLSKKLANCSQVKQFESSVEEFEKLIKQGVASKRGHNLLSMADAHLIKRDTNTVHKKSIKPTRKHAYFLDLNSVNYKTRNW